VAALVALAVTGWIEWKYGRETAHTLIGLPLVAGTAAIVLLFILRTERIRP
jgi:hypothetical protein